MQSDNENATDYFKEEEEFMPTWESDTSWCKAPPIPNGFRKPSKKRGGGNFTKSRKRK